MSGFSSIDASALAELLARGEPVALVDVRNSDEVARGVIEGARHIPLGLLTQRFQELERDRPVIFYCQSGMRSMQASAFLSARGWQAVFNLSGGVMAWARSGLALTKLDDKDAD